MSIVRRQGNFLNYVGRNPTFYNSTWKLQAYSSSNGFEYSVYLLKLKKSFHVGKILQVLDPNTCSFYLWFSLNIPTGYKYQGIIVDLSRISLKYFHISRGHCK